MKRYLIPSILALSFFAQGCIIVADDDDATLTVQNDSSYIIDYLYITPSYSGNWGPDLLGSRSLYPGESATVSVDCGEYDVLVVDEFGVECALYDFDLCFDDSIWYVDNFTLDVCAFGVTESNANVERSPRESTPEANASDADAPAESSAEVL
ncbi:MAG: hypothetical protein Tsb0020_28320 [Haliangiales bacterium]